MWKSAACNKSPCVSFPSLLPSPHAFPPTHVWLSTDKQQNTNTSYPLNLEESSFRRFPPTGSPPPRDDRSKLASLSIRSLPFSPPRDFLRFFSSQGRWISIILPNFRYYFLSGLDFVKRKIIRGFVTYTLINASQPREDRICAAWIAMCGHRAGHRGEIAVFTGAV